VFIFVNFSFALFTPPLGDYHCWFTGPNDIDRIKRGPGTNLSWDELAVLVGGITKETFVPESLILPQATLALYDDPGLRMVILAMLSTLDESGVAVR
jgi:hypothetical protein